MPKEKRPVHKRIEYQAERNKTLSNLELLEEVVDMAGGDDWEGAFTNVGMVEFINTYTDLLDRLQAAGFISPDDAELKKDQLKQYNQYAILQVEEMLKEEDAKENKK